VTQYKPKRRPWTAAEVDQLTREYADTKTSALAMRWDRATSHVYAKAKALGLKKSARYLASPDACRLRRGDNVGAAYRYPPGHVPANKGLRRRPGWAPGRMAEGQFKKGHRPQTWTPVGTEVRDGDGYLKRKVSDDRSRPSRFNWRYVHVLLWEAAHGPVPPGYALKFIDNDHGNVALNNLCLVSRADLARLNVMWNRYPRALCEVIQLRGALNRKINRRIRDEKQVARSA
jgi:hypothetical protein